MDNSQKNTGKIRAVYNGLILEDPRIMLNNFIIDAAPVQTEDGSFLFRLNDAITAEYKIIPGSHLADKVVLHANQDTVVASFSFTIKVATENPNVFFLPFPDNSCKPEPKHSSDMESKTYRCEGLILEGEKCISVAKPPRDADASIELIIDGSSCRVGGAAFGTFRNSQDQHDLASTEGFKPLVMHKGDKYDFGLTIYNVCDNVMDTFKAYRNDMSSWGVRMPDNYNPPLNYCIYYDCGGQFNRQIILDCAKTAADLGCGLLYTDQGWETSFGSAEWDVERLGTPKSIVDEVAKYGLKVGVLVPLHSDNKCFPDEAYIQDEKGNIPYGDYWHVHGVCPCSLEYKKIREKVLFELADAGVYFYSFDFNDNINPCYSEKHLHDRISSDVDHARGIADIQADLKNTYGDRVLIEAHDWIDSGNYRMPISAFNRGNHERWGFEYMWKPLEDYASGRVQNLYYYNLSYEKPMYLHMDLLGGGENAEVFWYYASMYRHLGIGNFNALDDKHKELFKTAIKAYTTVQKILSCGTFTGYSPLANAHSLDGQAVIAMFSDGTDTADYAEFSLEELGLKEATNVELIWGNAEYEIKDGKITIRASLGSSDAAVIKIS